MRKSSVGWWRIAAICALAAVPAALLWPFRDAAFVSDDRWFATVPFVDRSGHWLIAPWPHPFGPAHAYRPLVLLTYTLTLWYSSGSAFVFHLTNFLIHGATAALLGVLLWRLSGSWVAGVFGGLIFAIHPITHENVVWISGRTYPLAALFGMALLCWTSVELRTARWLRHAVGVGLLAGALLSYEMAVTLPLMVLAIRFYTDPQQGNSNLRRGIRAVRFAAPYFGVLAAYLIFRWAVLSSFSGDFMVWRHGTHPSPLLKNVRLRMLDNVGTLVSRLLNADDAPFGPLLSLRTASSVATAVLAGIATWGVARCRDTRGLALGALALATVAFAPAVVGPGYTDRLTYLTLAGIAGFLAIGLTAAWPRLPSAGRIALVFGIFATLVCWGTRYRALGSDWQHAGVISESLLDQLVALEPTPAPRAQLHFVDIPDTFGAAHVYLTYFHHSVRHRYRRDDLVIVTHLGEPISAIVATLTASTAKNTDDPSEVSLFRWDEQTERLLPLWRKAPSARAGCPNPTATPE